MPSSKPCGSPLEKRLSLVVAICFLLTWASAARADALDRLKPEKLDVVHQAIIAIRGERRPLPRSGPYREYRANLHVHSHLSHDSRAKLDTIVPAAQRAGTQVLLFTEHPAEHYDFYKDGHRGMRDGVLLIPGAESGGFLVYPTGSLRGLTLGKPQEFCDLVRGRGGLMFLCHLEERMDWTIRGLTGVEIYNTHADFKDERRLQAALRNPLWLIQSAELFRKYPQEAFSALQDYPADYLKRWDQLCQTAPHTGVAANDSHQNVGLAIKLLEGDKIRGEDALAKQLFELDVGSLPLLQPLRKDKKPGDVLFQIQLDKYENSLRHAGTHLLLTELTEKGVWEALEAGRAFVAFDWLADATGFDCSLRSAKGRHELGSRLPFEDGLRIQAQAPLPVRWKVMRDGKAFTEATGRSLDAPVAEAGVYRIEAWLPVAGEDMMWILTNPFYLRR